MRNRQAQEEEMTAVRNKARQHETLLQELVSTYVFIFPLISYPLCR